MLKIPFVSFCCLLFLVSGLRSQVNLQTGSATFSLPVFNWQDDKSRLNSIVALSYNSGTGLKVDEIASNIGQNWNLVAGGVITRMQVGEPDDQFKRDGNEYDLTKYPSGILYATNPAYKGCPTALTKYPIYKWKNQLYAERNEIAEDKELDFFTFQFNGKAGMFILDPTNLGVAYSLGDSKIKITYQQDANLQNQGIRTRITSFTIQDVDGLIYKFATHGLTKVLRAKYCHGNLTERLDQPNFKGEHVYHQAGFDDGVLVNPYVIGSWYLTEIEDALTHRKVYFNYVNRNINMRAGETIMHNSNKNYTIIFHKKSVSVTPALTSIVYPDGHNVNFNYGAGRIDLNNDLVMTSIDVTYQGGRFLSRHELNTTYVMLNRYGTPVSDYQKRVARLYLKSVKKIGVDLKEDSPPYIFDYYLGSNTSDDFVPPPYFYAKDIWGYYNGDNSKGYWLENIPLNTTITQLSSNQATLNKQLKGLCFMRNGVSGPVLNAKPGYAKNGLLRQIIYPTGGTLTYEYEQNTGILNGALTNVGGVHVSQTKSTDGGFSNGCANPIATQYSYVLDLPSSPSSLWGLEMPVNSMFSTSHFEPEVRYYRWSGCGLFGCCDWRFKHPGIISQQQAVDLTVLQNSMQVVSTVLGIINVFTTIHHVVKAFSGNPAALVVDIIVSLVTTALTCVGNQAKDFDQTVFYNFDLNGSSPLPSQFKRVVVTESPGTIGKTVYQFTSDDQYSLWVGPGQNIQFSAKQRFAPWAYGLPLKTSVYDAGGTNKVKETENVYSFTNVKQIIKPCDNNPESGLPPCYPTGGIPSAIVSCNCDVVRSVSQRNPDWSNSTLFNNPASYITSSNNDLKVDFYGMFTGRVSLASSYQRDYKPNDPSQFVETISEYNYSSYNFEVNKVTVTQSNGDKYISETSYSSDIGGSIYNTLQSNNILTIPVVSINSVIKSGTSTSQDIGETRTNLIQLTNGDIKPGSISERRSDKPYNRFPYPPTLPEVQTFTYDANGKLIGLKDEGARLITNLYDYNEKYIVASVINADPILDKCAYASFEPSSNGWVGWTVGGSPLIYGSSAVTGTRALSLAPGISLTRTSLNSAKPYTVSFWSTTATITVSGSPTLIKSSPTINGFTYYEYDIPQGTSQVTVSGTGVIDELRLYPKNARMRTITYDPLIGKTTECDENNRITYYEYDNLGRLRFIKDENRNIVKMYEYNNISLAKQNGCPGIYYNKLISEVFTKSNCSSGYIGSEVTYTVPANTYSSTISQADADAQAENNILTNGQAYANANGTCIPIYYNTVQSQNFTTENCPPGYVGGIVTYTVPANRYSSLISQADANLMATDEIESNGQAYANDPANQVCTYSTAPVWEWLEGDPWYCLSVNGNLPPHLFILETDINPNSSTYLQTRWSDVGPSELCPSGNYYNSQQSQNFTRNNCPSGYTGSTVTYTVPPGTYSSTVSQAAANQLALNDINANGQAYANANGTCTPNSGCSPSNCSGEDKKCVNGVCETGVKVYTESYWIGPHLYECIYHYEWSDGSWSEDYIEESPYPCQI